MCGGTAAGCAGGTGDVKSAAGAESQGPPGKTPWAAIRRPGHEAMAPDAPAGRSLPDIIGRKSSSCRRRDVSRRGLSHVQGPRGPARSPVRNGDAPASLFWSSGRVQPHSSNVMGGDRSALPYWALWVIVLSRWTGALWRWVICLGVRWPRRLTLTLLAACVTKPSKDDTSAGARDTFTGAASTSTLNKIASAAPKPAPASL